MYTVTLCSWDPACCTLLRPAVIQVGFPHISFTVLLFTLASAYDASREYQSGNTPNPPGERGVEDQIQSAAHFRVRLPKPTQHFQ